MNMPRCLFFLLAVLIVSGCSPRNEYEPPPPPEVETRAPIVQDTVVYRSYPGRLQAIESVAIYARVQGRLEEVAFTDGDLVKAGDLLFRIEPDAYEADVKGSSAQLAQAQAAAKLAKTTRARKERAFQAQAISEIDFLAADADVQAATAAIEAAEATLAKAQLNLSYTIITAPISGRLDRSLISAGNLVGGPQPALLTTLVGLDPIDCYFAVDERAQIQLLNTLLTKGHSIAALSPAVKLELADGTVYEQTGIIDFTETAVDPSTGTLMVRARFPNPDGQLVPGMFGRVRIPFEQPQAMLIPERALLRDMIGSYVLVVRPDSIVESRYLTLGPLVETQRIITEGLNGDEQVAVSGLQRIRPGMTVQVRSATVADSGN